MIQSKLGFDGVTCSIESSLSPQFYIESLQRLVLEYVEENQLMHGIR